MTRNIPIDIYVFGIPQILFEKLFPKKNNTNKSDFIIEERYRLIQEELDVHEWNSLLPPIICQFFQNNIYYNGYKCKEILDNNLNKIFFNLYDVIKKSKNKNIIIINFGNPHIKEFSILLNRLNCIKPFILFIVDSNQINNNLFNNFKEPQYISYLEKIQNSNNNSNELYYKILDFFWEKVRYFYDLGKSPCHFFYPKGFIEYNILLIGESRAGKSAFINRIYNKLVSHEGDDLSSVTKNVKEFKIYLTDTFGGINIIDSPGLVKKEEFELIKKQIDHHISKIHLILFFIKAQSNIEQSIGLLQYIKDKNIQIYKERKFKIPIIFIKNGEDLDLNNKKPPIFDNLKKELKRNNLLELYDPSIDIKNKNKEKIDNEINEDNFFDENEEDINNYDNYIEGNIIQIHLPTGKNINKIFTLSKEYLLKYNKYIIEEENEEFKEIKKDAKKLIQLFIKKEFEKNKLSSKEIQEKNELFLKCNDFVKKTKSKYSILSNLPILEIRGKENLFKKILFFALAAVPLTISMFLPSFFMQNVQNSYDSFCNFITYTAIQYGFDRKDIEDYGFLHYLIKYIRGDKNEKDQKKINERTCEIFEKIIEYIGPIQCLIKARELSREIFSLLNFLENKKDWIKFKIEKI